MTRWSQNVLTVQGPEPVLDSFVTLARGSTPNYTDWSSELVELSFHRLLPVPDVVLDKPFYLGGYTAQYRLWGGWGAQQAQIIARDRTSITYRFRTGWVAPKLFLEAISNRWPGLIFYLSCSEDGATDRYLIRGGVIEEESRTAGQVDIYTRDHYCWLDKVAGRSLGDGELETTTAD